MEKKSDDGEGNDSPISSVVKKILEDLGAHNVEVNKRILNVFKKNISILHTAFKRASKSGGKALKKLVNGWKFGPNYKFKVFYNEVDVLKLKDDCDRLIAHALGAILRNPSSKITQNQMFHSVGKEFDM